MTTGTESAASLDDARVARLATKRRAPHARLADVGRKEIHATRSRANPSTRGKRDARRASFARVTSTVRFARET